MRTAEALASELGGRSYGRGWRAPCPGHPDKHPSLDIADRDGRILFIDRSGRCTQDEIITALQGRGLWAPSPSGSRSPAPVTTPTTALIDRPLPDLPGCCRSGPPHRCEHWRAFDHEFLVAHMLGNLEEAAAEVTELYHTAQMKLDLETLVRELNYAIPFGAIVPKEIDDPDVINKAVGTVARETLEAQR
jgi:hypothetical protein